MKAQDLRIGNLVSQLDELFIVSTETFYEMQLHDDLYKPIPLDEEWLVRIGFSKDRIIRINLDTTSEHLHVTKDGSVLIYDRNNDFICLGSIKYVHQLQNLYHALTGEELTTKQS